MKSINYLVMNTKKTLGYLEKETPKSVYVDKFIALRSKAYSIVVDNKNENILKCNKKFCKNEIAFEQGKDCLEGEKYNQNIKQNVLKAKKQEIYIQSITEKAFDRFDDKRNYISKKESVPFGYFS